MGVWLYVKLWWVSKLDLAALEEVHHEEVIEIWLCA